MSTGFAGTQKQTEIMTLVCAATARGQAINTKDLRVALSWKPKLATFHCSLAFLKKHKMLIVENHGPKGGTVRPTAAGYALFKPKPT